MTRRLAVALLALLACGAAFSQVHEEELKAAFVFNVAGFVDWPPAVPGEPAELVACVPARSALRGPLQSLAGQAIGSRTWRVRALAAGDEAGPCHLVIGMPPPRQAGGPTLTFAESADLRPTTAAVTFGIVDQRLRFRVNLQAIRQSQLSISSKVLRLAHAVDAS